MRRRGKRAERTYQSIVLHIFSTIFATGRELLSQKANGSHPYNDIKISNGISMVRMRAAERSAGRVTTSRVNPPVTTLTRG